MFLIPRISVTVDHEANRHSSEALYQMHKTRSRFAIRADRVCGLQEMRDGSVLIQYTAVNGQTVRTFVEEDYSFLFTEIRGYGTIQ